MIEQLDTFCYSNIFFPETSSTKSSFNKVKDLAIRAPHKITSA